MKYIPIKGKEGIDSATLHQLIKNQNRYLTHVVRITIHDVNKIPKSLLLPNDSVMDENTDMIQWLFEQQDPQTNDYYIFAIDKGPND